MELYEEVSEIYNLLTKKLIAAGLTISTMESCTGGLISSLITDTEGSSAIFAGSFVTYSNQAKLSCGVEAGIIEKYGVYSQQTAQAMAEAAARAYGADIGVGVTGTFGNVDPANDDSQPGEVHFAVIFGGAAELHSLALNPVGQTKPYIASSSPIQPHPAPSQESGSQASTSTAQPQSSPSRESGFQASPSPIQPQSAPVPATRSAYKFQTALAIAQVILRLLGTLEK